MGIHPELTSPRRGAALPASLFGLVTITLLASAIFSASSMQSSASRNRESSTRALQLAEDGLAHAVTVARDSLRPLPFTRLLRGSDNTGGNSDDGRLIGYTLSSAIDIPIAGRTFGSGQYTVEITDDNDGDGNMMSDANQQVRMRCTAVTSDGGRAVLDVVLGVAAIPAIASNGDLEIAGSMVVTGICGGVHANDDLAITGGNPIVAGTLTSSDDVSGSAKDTLGNVKVPIGDKPQVVVPSMTYEQFCGAQGTNATLSNPNVEFWFTSTGLIYRKGNPTPYDAVSAKQFGWRYTDNSPVTWTFANPTATPGMMCIEGNVEVSSNVGSASSPMAWTIIATGSVEVSGTPFLVPATTDSIAIVSGGDVSISGNPSGLNENYEGLIYANAQCEISGNPNLYGQVLCKDNPTGAGNIEYASANLVTGNPTLTYQCGGMFSRRRVFSWTQRVE